MANEPRGAWARPRPAATRTPQQSRSLKRLARTCCTSRETCTPTAPAPAAPAGNVWAQRAAAQKPAAAVAPKAAKKEQSVNAGVQETQHVSVNNFNEGEVKQMLAKREAGSVYKPDYSGNASSAPNADAACMANGKNFWAHLEEQVAAAKKKEGQ
ncbi:unnamed protein product [Aureobasidium uvarum]|uniref:Uncharacterized protein n=1 Tax=Aureobasidium uvarum TaxID=2773716 RepID=A0A9N8KNI3_9PEZI|nr:unnamed protein product [Aureobasidium uvarum]